MSDYPRFRPLFAEALDRRLYTIEHLDRLVFSGRAQIWFGDAAAIVTEVRTYPTGARVIRRARASRSRALAFARQAYATYAQAGKHFPAHRAQAGGDKPER